MQFLAIFYLLIGILFVVYLILGIKAFSKYLKDDSEKHE